MFKDFFSAWPVIDVPLDAGGDAVDATESVNALRIDTRAGVAIVGLAGGLGLRLGFRVGLAGAGAGAGAGAMPDLEFVDTRVSLDGPLRCRC